MTGDLYLGATQLSGIKHGGGEGGEDPLYLRLFLLLQ